MSTNRRDFIAGSAGIIATLANLHARAAGSADAAVERLLAGIAEELLADYPENATGLGIDTGARAPLKSRLTDRSAAGQAAVARRGDPQRPRRRAHGE